MLPIADHRLNNLRHMALDWAVGHRERKRGMRRCGVGEQLPCTRHVTRWNRTALDVPGTVDGVRLIGGNKFAVEDHLHERLTIE